MSYVRKPTNEELRFLRSIMNYQFMIDEADKVITDDVLLRVSKNTGRIRAVLDGATGKTIATLVASTHTFNLWLEGGLRLHRVVPKPKLRVVVFNEISDGVVEAKSTVFAKHVLSIDEDLRSGDEVLVVDEDDNLLCVGRLVLSPDEVMQLLVGPAVKVRECVKYESG